MRYRKAKDLLRSKSGWLLCVFSAGVWAALALLFWLADFRAPADLALWAFHPFGGVAPTGQPDPISLLCWYAWLFPGFLAALSVSQREMGSRRFLVLPRLGSAGRWLRRLYGRLLWQSVGYTLFGAALYLLWGIAAGCTPAKEVSVPALLLTCLCAALHLAVIALWAATAGLLWGHRAALGLFLLADAATAVLGGLLRTHSPFLLGSIGMGRQGTPTAADLAVLAVLLLLPFVFSRVSARRALQNG